MLAARALFQLVHLDKLRRANGNDKKLRDPLASGDADWRLLVGVEQQNLQLAAVTLVDQARCVDDRQAVFGSQAGARDNQAGMTCRQFDRDPGGDLYALTRRNLNRVERAEIEPGVAGVGPPRHYRAWVKPLETQNNQPSSSIAATANR